MSEHEQSEVTAAATGAAAAVAAVQDENAEAERAASMEAATETASVEAEIAAERAESAAEAAEQATQAAEQATQDAATAGIVASEAAQEAYSAKDDIAILRTEINAGFEGFRAHLDETFGSKRQEQPTEVVVTNESRTDNTSEQHTDTGGTSSAQSGEPERRSRHRFGNRR